MNVKHFIEEKILLFEFTEELDHHESEKIRKRADYEIQRFMPKKVILGLILGRYKSTSCYGGNVELINVKPKIKKIIEMAGILKIIAIKDNVKEQMG